VELALRVLAGVILHGKDSSVKDEEVTFAHQDAIVTIEETVIMESVRARNQAGVV